MEVHVFDTTLFSFATHIMLNPRRLLADEVAAQLQQQIILENLTG